MPAGDSESRHRDGAGDARSFRYVGQDRLINDLIAYGEVEQ